MDYDTRSPRRAVASARACSPVDHTQIVSLRNLLVFQRESWHGARLPRRSPWLRCCAICYRERRLFSAFMPDRGAGLGAIYLCCAWGRGAAAERAALSEFERGISGGARGAARKEHA